MKRRFYLNATTASVHLAAKTGAQFAAKNRSLLLLSELGAFVVFTFVMFAHF